MVKKLNFKMLIEALLNSISQIMLQENPITGLIFLIGIFIGSVNMGLATLLAVISATTIAYLLKYPLDEIRKGLYGFSAALVGVALLLFFNPSATTWGLVIFGSVLATVLQHFFITRKLSVFTFPFVLVTWLIYYSVRLFYPELLTHQSPLTPSSSDIYVFYFESFGQVIFQHKLISGVLFFIGIAINSRKSVICGLIGAVVASIFSYLLKLSYNDILLGLLGYNAVLCAIAVSYTKKRDLLWIIFSSILSVFLIIIMKRLNIIVLTFPFVVATMLTLYLKRIAK